MIDTSIYDPETHAERYRESLTINLVTSLLSVLACSALLLACVRDKALRQHPAGIIHWAVFCDLMFSAKFLLGVCGWLSSSAPGSTLIGKSFNMIDDGCRLETLVGQVFSTGSVLWNLVWVIDFSMSLYSPLRSSAHLQNYYHLAVWSFTLTTAVYITVLKYYGPGPDGSCFTQPNARTGWTSMWPLYITALCGCLSVPYAAVALSRGSEENRNLRRTLLQNHAAYVFVFVFCWMWVVVHRTGGAAAEASTTLLRLDVFGMTSQAGLLAMVRLYQAGVLHQACEVLTRCCRADRGEEVREARKVIQITAEASELTLPLLSQLDVVVKPERSELSYAGKGSTMVDPDMKAEDERVYTGASTTVPVTVTTTRPLQVYTLATAPTHVAPVISVISSATIASDTTLAVTDGVDDPPPVSVPSPIVMPRSLRRDVPRHLATVARPQLPAFNPRRMLDGVAAALLRPSDTAPNSHFTIDATSATGVGSLPVASGRSSSGARASIIDTECHTIPLSEGLDFIMFEHDTFCRVHYLYCLDAIESSRKIAGTSLSSIADPMREVLLAKNALLLKIITPSEAQVMMEFLTSYIRHLNSPTNDAVYSILTGNPLHPPPDQRISESYRLTGGLSAIASSGMMSDAAFSRRGGLIRLGPRLSAMLMTQLQADVDVLKACNVTDYALVVGISKQDRPVLEAGELSSSAPRVAVSTAADGAIIGDEVYVFGLVDVLHRSPKVYSNVRSSVADSARYAAQFVEFVRSIIL